jgi:hypothetical protein
VTPAQLALPLGAGSYQGRVELPIAVITWRADGERREVVMYPHSIDHAWPWWRPELPPC